MAKDKKMVAAISAVMSYINQEQSMVAVTGEVVSEQAPGFSAPAASVKMWGLSGRQAQMQFGNQMQLKMFHGTNSR